MSASSKLRTKWEIGLAPEDLSRYRDLRGSLSSTFGWAHDLMYSIYKVPDALHPLLDLFESMLFERSAGMTYKSEIAYWEAAWVLLDIPRRYKPILP